jgi:hypothetical protein
VTTTNEIPVLLRAWIMAARWGPLDALVALKLTEEDQQEKAKRRLHSALLSLDEFRNGTAHEEYRG